MGVASSAPMSRTVMLLACAGGHPAAACDPTVFTGGSASYDTRISVKPDCSFQDTFVERYGASADFTVNSRSGGPARDIGNGRIGQKIVPSEMCGPSEALLFLDCTTGETIAIRGVPSPLYEDSSLAGSFIEFIQAPYGPIRLNAQSTVAELKETAKANDLDVIEDAPDLLAGTRKRDRYDAYCGCKLYYPDSAGAKIPKP
jgi:hypothetical protein